MFVDRDGNGNIRSAYACRQFEGQEEVPAGNPALVAFINRPPPPPPVPANSPLRQFGRNVKISSDGCPAAIGDNASDDYGAIQAHLDYLASTGGGFLMIPRGQYRVSQPIVVRSDVGICGEKFATGIWATGTNGVMRLDNTGSHCLRDIGLYGDHAVNPTTPTLQVDTNAEVFIDGVRCWFGSPALRMYGTDGTISNSFFWSRTCSIENYGSNWWKRVKIDDVLGHTQFAFASGANTPENYFDQCDFSGDFGYSFFASGVGGAVLKFSDCVFSSPIDVTGVQWAKFEGCTFGSTLTANGAAITVANSYSFGPMVVPNSGGLKNLSNNFNIS